MRRSVCAKSVVRAAQIVFGICYVVGLSYLSVVAAAPGVRSYALGWLQWFGSPGSWVTLAIMLGLPAVALTTTRRVRNGASAVNPVLVLAGMAASALVLAVSAYWRCHDDQSVFFAPLSWALGLFVGNVEGRYGSGGTGRCAALSMPLALELARVLAIGTTFAAALSAAVTLFRAQFDRLAIWRARAVTVVVDVDEDTTSMLRAIAQNTHPRTTLVVIVSSADNPASAEARELGARVRVVSLFEPQILRALRLWKRLDQLYLLSEDPFQNESRLQAINAAMNAFGDVRLRLPLTVRIDDPWQAEVWRRSFLEAADGGSSNQAQNRRWVADAVGRYEITAANLVRHLTGVRDGSNPGPAPDVVVLCGMVPLTFALTSEFAQVAREQDMFARPRVVLPERVVIMADRAPGFVEDHRLRQRRMAPGQRGVTLEALIAEPTLEAVAEYLGQFARRRCAVIIADPSAPEGYGTRLAQRFPNLLIYQVSTAVKTLPESSIIGCLYPFPVNMEIGPGAPLDAWERAAEQIHEHYCAGRDRDERAAKRWHLLDPFYKQSNRRLVVNTLWMVEDEGHTWNTLESPPAPALPDGFDTLKPLEQLRVLGFNPETVSRMIDREHEDWRRFYTSAGWRYSPTRDDDRLRHDRLLPWHELVARDAELIAKGIAAHDDQLFATRAQKNLVSTLRSLRTLGYRSTSKSTGQWQRFRRCGEISAKKLGYEWPWTDRNGNELMAQPGSWKVTDDAGFQRSVTDEAFVSSYAEIGQGRYRRTGIFRARRVAVQEVVPTDEGEAIVYPGDWVVEGTLGERWPVPADEFGRTYEGPIAD